MPTRSDADGRSTLPIPPQPLRFMGEDEAAFLSIGDSLVATAEALCDLPTSPTIVDVGSGYGRVAHALWRRGFNGRYLGVERAPTDRTRTSWCSVQA